MLGSYFLTNVKEKYVPLHLRVCSEMCLIKYMLKPYALLVSYTSEYNLFFGIYFSVSKHEEQFSHEIPDQACSYKHT